MKNLIILCALVSMASCQQIAGYFNNESNDSAKASTNRPVVERDLSINESNSYSDLFLDSTAVEGYIRQNQMPDSVANGMRSFYNSRNLQYAWFSSEGLTEQGRGIWSLVDNGQSNTKDDFDKRMDSLASEDSISISRTDSTYAKLELSLTQKFITLKDSIGGPGNSPDFIFIPARKQDVVAVADSMLKIPADTNSSNPLEKQFAKLKSYLQKYYELAKSDTTSTRSLSTIKKDKSSTAALKRYLYITGDYAGADTSQVSNDSLKMAIRSFQKRHGLKEDGNISDSMLRIINVPAKERMEQIIINMNRLAWAPGIQKNYIQVNIPEYKLRAYENDTTAFDMDVIVGKEGTNTVMFSGKLNEIVFSPYWNIPESIVRDEIMPAMKKDATYLKKNNMEIVNQNDSIPTIRQLPGDKNALGKVKFLFPNSFDIYLHDTPHKNLFNKDNRALSHGCIRVANAEKLAQHLLKDQQSWTPEKIKTAMNSGKEQHVKLNGDLPVLITYYTAWVDDKGKLNFRDDVYGHDDKTARMMFTGQVQDATVRTDSLNNNQDKNQQTNNNQRNQTR